ncbi:MAG: hypothetical protein QXO32_09040 [Candidatus Bathyarchaeia archaeon]
MTRISPVQGSWTCKGRRAKGLTLVNKGREYCLYIAFRRILEERGLEELMNIRSW